ncbi:MAG: response regulator [Myxococcales bacterium]|nr:response regulator [Myxococcales bacterium]
MADRPLRILLADDNAIVQKITLAVLERLGYEARGVMNGADAVAALKTDSFDAVLMDVQMPVKDGLQATAEIRATLPPERQPYIVGITASITGEICEACLAAGMDDYLSKPFAPQALEDALEEARRRRPE